MRLYREALAAWQKEMERAKRPGAATAAKYLTQVSSFPGTLTSDLTTPAIRKWLERLPATIGQTNRYRSAMSAFCAFLVREGVLDRNPVRDVPAQQESRPRDRHLAVEEVDRLAQWLDETYGLESAAFQVFLAATAADVSSALDVKVADFCADNEVWIRGTKTATRRRICYVTKSWNALWRSYVEPLRRIQGARGPESAWLFQTPAYTHRRQLEAGLAALGIEDYTMKDHRHTWAVQAFKDGLPLHAIAHQLGHASPAMALKVYGQHQSRRADFGL